MIIYHFHNKEYNNYNNLIQDILSMGCFNTKPKKVLIQNNIKHIFY